MNTNFFPHICLIILFFAFGCYAQKYLFSKCSETKSLSLMVDGIGALENKNHIEALELLYASMYIDSNRATIYQGLGIIFYEEKAQDLSIYYFKKFIDNALKNDLSKNSNRLNIDVPMAMCFIADSFEGKKSLSTSKKYYGDVMSQFPYFIKYLKSYNQVIDEKNQKNIDDIKRHKLYSKFIVKISASNSSI